MGLHIDAKILTLLIVRYANSSEGKNVTKMQTHERVKVKILCTVNFGKPFSLEKQGKLCITLHQYFSKVNESQ